MIDEKTIPIDITISKLLDWLISRRHCQKEWQKHDYIIRQKINDAIQDMPAVDEIAELLMGAHINYFHCCQIVEILKKTEASSKNIFGQYSSQRMKDWQEIIRLYEKDNIYLAEAAQMLMRNVQYEIPSLKKQIAKCTQIQEECLKKQVDYHKNGDVMKEKYYSSCAQLGILGQNIKKELLSLLDNLPETMSNISSAAKCLKPATSYYMDFLSYTMNSECGKSLLPLLCYIIEKGNTTTYEWRTGKQPDIIEVTQLVLPLDVDNGSSADDQIDFGDFGITSESGDDRSSSSPNGDFVHVDKEECRGEVGDQIDFGDNEADINWDIAVETSSSTNLQTGQNSEGGQVARGEDALSILENPETRNLLYNDLLELDGFLQQRIFELKNTSDVLYTNIIQSAPSSIQLQSDKCVSDMVTSVKSVMSQLMSTKMKHLYLIKESSKYVDRLTDLLKAKLDTSDKMFLLEKNTKEKGELALDEQSTLEPKVELIIKKTKELQYQMEGEISKRYKNRPVNIVGGIKHI